MPEPSHIGSSVYTPITVARDPRSTHPMVTHHAGGVTKPVNRVQLFAATAPPTLSLVSTSVRSALVDPHWHRTMKEYEALLSNSTWDLVPWPPRQRLSPTSGSSSTSSSQMALLIGTRLVGCSGGSLSASG
jgi:hypothetical protein